MWKFALKFGWIILINLFAFLGLWFILDALFETEGLFVIVCLVLSVLSLIVIWGIFMKKTLNEFKNISPEKEEKENDEVNK